MTGMHRMRTGPVARIGKVLAPAVALTAVVGGTAFYTGSGATLDLSVDGQVRQVDSRASTVGDMLAAQSISLSAYDIVSPDVDATLQDGQTVEVRHARDLMVIVDGETTTYSTTQLTVGEALADLGVDVTGASLSLPLGAELPREATSVTVSTPKQLTLSVGGKTRTVTSAAATVEDLLDEQDVDLAAADTLNVGVRRAVTDGMKVTVTRVRTEQVTRTEKVSFDTTERKDSDLTVGTRKTITAGVPGARQATYQVSYVNGKTSDKKLLSATVTKQPVDAVVAVGTKPRPATDTGSSSGSSSGGAADGLNWAGLAKCESGGNPRAVNSAGYYGLYQFSLSTWRSVGGSGNPANASSAEQTRRAKILYNKAGAGQWPSCGKYLFS